MQIIDGTSYDYTNGFDPVQAAKILVEQIYPEVIQEAQKVLVPEDPDYIILKKNLDQYWKGKAKTEFITKLEANMQAINQQLTNEYTALYNRFYEMQTNFKNFDEVQSQKI